jgi:hypothetical protein
MAMPVVGDNRSVFGAIMGMFQQTPNHLFIGRVWSDPDNRHDKREVDHNLYLDLDALQFIIVEEIEHTSGANTSCHHEIHAASDYVNRYPERREQVKSFIRAKCQFAEGQSNGAA